MPDIPNRGDLERELGQLFGLLLVDELRWLLDQLGDPPDPQRVIDWSRLRDATAHQIRAIETLLELIYREAAERVVDEMGIGVDWGLINEEAVRWASEYTYDLVDGIDATSRRVLQQIIPQFFEQPMTRAELRRRLAPTFGPVRAEMISITEVTRAAAQGELAVARLLASAGIQSRAIWQTNRDEHVCPVCLPRHNKQQGDGWAEPPPAHQRCRCWLRHEIVEVAGG